MVENRTYKSLTFLVGISLLSVVSCYSQNTLFKKYAQNPLFNVGSSEPFWRTRHVANATVLTNEETPDGTWRIYMRGNGDAPYYTGQIGLVYQDSTDFSPYGPWLEYENNPVLQAGIPGSYDDRGMLDPAPVVGENGDIYMYFKAHSYTLGGSLAGAKSTDGGYTFEKFGNNPLKRNSGGSDALFIDDNYYVYYTNSGSVGMPSIYLKISPDPVNIKSVDSLLVLTTGGGPDNFDTRSVAAGRIFKIKERWYLIYPGSDSHFDFPHRFHAAWSDDLINWTKIDNDFPLMTRGDWGDWDQGGLWYGEVFEHQDTLYMLYEGWGCYCIPDDRDDPYFPGHSRTGIASVPVDDFLLWAEGGYDSSWVVKELGPDGTVVDFETYSPEFNATHDMYFEVIENPFPDDVNSSAHVGMIETTADRWESVESEPFVNRFDFKQGKTFTMKVYSETEGDVYFRVEHPDRTDFGEIQVRKALNVTNQWVEMTFDFSGYDPEPDLYGKIVLYFDGGETNSGNNWYFDDITFIQSTNTGLSEDMTGPGATQDINLLYDLPNQQIRLEGVSNDTAYAIYSISGMLLRKDRGNIIDVATLPAGSYILRIQEHSTIFIK